MIRPLHPTLEVVSRLGAASSNGKSENDMVHEGTEELNARHGLFTDFTFTYFWSWSQDVFRCVHIYNKIFHKCVLPYLKVR